MSVKTVTFGLILSLTVSLAIGVETVAAQETAHEVVVKRIVTERKEEVTPGVWQPYQEVEVEILTGKDKGEILMAVLGGDFVSTEKQIMQVGDKVVVSHNRAVDGTDKYYVVDFVRRDNLLILTLIFLVSVVVVGGIRGVTSFLGLVVSFGVLVKFILPQILAGSNPVWVAIIGSMVILFTSLYLAHGLNRKTTAAVMGTFISLFLTAALAWASVNMTRLTGLGSEEAGYLAMSGGINLNLAGILLAGMIIGSLGVLDDITISQAACVFELKAANPGQSFKQLFYRGLRIGQDHIASVVNTLVLAYAGVSLPLLLLFVVSGGEPISSLVNREMIATEVVRTLVGSIGLVAAVPITTAIAAFMNSSTFKVERS